MGVSEISSINSQNKLIKKENNNNLYNLIPSKKSLKEKKALKESINSSKSNKKKNNNYYNLTEINKNYKIPTKKSCPKNKNNSNSSLDNNQILPKKSNSRNISFLKEEIQTKKKINKKMPIYTKDSSTKKKIHENLSFNNNSKGKSVRVELASQNNKIKPIDNCSSKKSISPKKTNNDYLYTNLSFNDLSINNNISYISFNNKNIINNLNNRNAFISQNKQFCLNKNNISQISKYNSRKIDNIKKIKKNKNPTKISGFNSSNKDKKFIKTNYNSNNSNDFRKKNIFSLKNDYSFYNKYSLYIIDDENNNNIALKNFSNEKDFIKILSQKDINEIKLVKDILKLEQRNWYEELRFISILISKTKNKMDRFFNQILEKYILIYEHFNWLIYSLSIYFKDIFYENENNKIKETFFNNDNNYILGLDNKIEKWFKGFKWKGIYIKVIPYKQGKTLINEIKALNYYFFDYLQIIDKNQFIKKNNIKKIQLSNNIIFPLIGYSKINNLILYISALIVPSKTNKNDKNEANSVFENILFEELIEQNNKMLNYYSEVLDNSLRNANNNEGTNNNILMINNKKKPKKFISLLTHKQNYNDEINNKGLESSLGKNYYIEDLLQSQLFKEINNYNLIKIGDGKFIIFNLAKYIPKLFEIKFKKAKKFNFYSEINKNKKFFTLNYNHILKKCIYKGKNKYIKTPLDVLDKIYNMRNNFTSPINYRDIYINNIYFRILYEETKKEKKDHKEKTFVDYLFTYNQQFNSNDISIDINTNKSISNIKNNLNNINNYWNEEKNYIKGTYVIIYDLIEPIKLDYSLIKQNKCQNDSESIYNLFFLKSNYFTFFYSWCEMINKNNFNIKTYYDLKYFMKKYSINTNLLFFSLIYIKNEDILDIIKIHLLIKVIYQIFIDEDINYNNRIKLNIILYIKNILYPHELTFGNERKEFNIFYSKILFYSTILFLKIKLIDDYMGLGLLNIKVDKHLPNNIYNHNKKMKEIIPGFDSPKEFIKNIILIARKKPFLFLTELEQKLNIIINPYIKFKSSLSIESMKGLIRKKYISFNNILIISYVNTLEISGLLLAKIINCDEPDKEKDTNAQSSNDSFNESNDETNISENKKNLEIRHNFKHNKMTNDIFKKEKKGNNDNNNDDNKYNINENNNIYINDGNLIEFNQDIIDIKAISKIQLTKNNINSKNNRLTSPKKNEKKEIHTIFWNDINNKISIRLPPICYKLLFNYEDKFINFDNKNKISISNYLKTKYNLMKSEFLENWKQCNLNIFQKIRTCNGNAESAILKSYIYLFIYYYFIKKKLKESKKITDEIKKIFKNNYYKLTLNELAIINLFQGLCCDKYIDSEEYFSKSLMLFLINYGDPRGRNNDSHGAIEYPLWILSRKVLKLKETILYENFKEMYQALDYFESKKYFSINNYNNNNKFNFNYTANVQNNISNILFLNNINKINNDYNINNVRANNSFNSNIALNYNSKKILVDLEKNKSFIKAPLSSIIHKDLTLNLSVFNNSYLEKEKNNFYFFPSISSKSPGINDEFYKENFIIYIFKQIQSLFMNRHFVLSNEYIDEIISNEIFNPEPHIIQEANYSFSNDSSSIDTKTKIEEKSNNSIKNYKNSIKDKNQENNNNKSNTNTESSIKHTINKKNNGNVFSHFLHVELLDKLSYKKNIPSGVIISFGNNCHNETSHDKYEMLTLPRVIFKLKNIIIDHIYSGWEHNIVLSNKGEIFSFGYNQSYQCGLPNSNLLCRNCINDPTNISKIHNLYGKYISCGNEHSLILSNNNEVYGIGSNEDGVLGLNDTKIKSFKPILIHFGENDEYTKKIKQISCGSVHNLALSDDGKIFSWGAAMGGQLGHEEKYFMKSSIGFKNYYLSKPTIISVLSDKNIIINKISCGEAHSIALSNNGNVYSWGYGSNGQLGLGFCEESFDLGKGLAKSRKLLPEKINISGIKNIQCGKTFTMFINSENKLLACGNNDINQLGFNHEKNYNKRKCHDFVFPTLIDSFSTFEVKKISCGEGHCLAIINDISFSGIQSLWSWGNNKFGQLGQGSTTKISLPKPINLLMDYSNYRCGFEEISCGGFHSLCLVKYKKT